MQIAPASTSSSPASIRSAVVLPEPDGPDQHHQLAVGDLEVERVDRRLVAAGIDPRRLLEAHLSHGTATSAQLAAARRASASRPGAELVEPEQRRAHDRRRRGHAHARTLRRRAPASIAPSRRPSPARNSPPPSSTSTAAPPSSSRSIAARTSATHLGARAARRSPAATGVGRGRRRTRAAAARRSAAAATRPRWIASASSPGVAEPEVRRHGALERGPRPAAVLAARRRRQRGEPDVVAAAPVAGDRAERGEAHVAAVGADADAVDARAAHDRDAPAALGAGAQDRERVVADAQASAQPRRRPRRAARSSSTGRSSPASSRWPTSARASPSSPARARASRVQLLEQLERAVEPEVVRRAAAAADEREHRAVVAHQREVGLRVAAVDGEHEPPAHRTGSPASSRSTSSPAISSWPISGWASSALRTSSGLPRQRRAHGEPLVGGDVLDEAEQLRRERRLARAATGPSGPTRAGTSTTSSSASPASVPPLRMSTTWTASPAPRQRGDDAGGGLAVERAAALLEQRGLLVQRRVAVHLEQLAARSRRPRPRAARPRAARPARGRARRSSAGSRTARRRAPRAAGAAARRPRRARRRGRPAASPSTSSPSSRTARTQVRWLSPTWSTSMRAGSTPSSCATWRWKPDRDVAEPDRAVAVRRAARA